MLPEPSMHPAGGSFSRRVPIEQVLSMYLRRIRKRVILCHGLVLRLSIQCSQRADHLQDMLGFKLEAPQRDGSATEQVRPIYLDLQVC
jgi:hypothetical protein